MRIVARLKGWFVELLRGCPRRKRRLRRWRGRDVLIIAHRGAGARCPENTIPACEAAISLERCTAIEIDLSLTADGHVVLWHDWDPNDRVAVARQSALEGAVGFRPLAPSIGSELRRPVNTLTLEELRAHYGYGTKSAVSTPVADAHIPTFEEFTEWAVTRPELTFVMFDVKVPPTALECVEPLLRSIEATLVGHSVTFDYVFSTPHSSVLEEMLQQWKRPHYALDVEPPTGLVLRPGRFSSVDAAIRLGISYATSVAPMVWTLAPWATYRRIIHHDVKLREKHNRRNPAISIRRVLSATINDIEQMTCLLGLGIDGLITDRPEVVRDAAAQVGRGVC